MNSTMKSFNTAPTSLLIFFLLILSCGEQKVEKSSRVDALPYYAEATFTPNWLAAGDPLLDDFHQISPFQLVNQQGDTITEKTFEGSIYITDFFFTACPGICPKMTANMGLLQEAFLEDEEVLLLSHSVTPAMDSVPVLQVYAEVHEVQAHKWHLATGSQEEIYKLGRQDYFVEEDLGLGREADDFLHTENFVLIDKRRHIRGIYNGLNKSAIQQLIADVQTLKEEG
ncbi:MAG: SCO family protein [Bacteroidota bacterium]